ncbi:MAG: hypothetical protein F2942_09080 [Actinobacteria bacterium]|uniref:Unannotated protein n=2 Tax=freshwater metagenome TaxID=449393 RepID=A0A6J6XMP6_9ZZZZ|nr:hypothetical protein [Actinomycetota bacterium]MSX74436.1 hypothetical protein [Actinomycetota bacterium]MSY22521.1 hypothetical protein [Actinomycetota bacterium]MTA74855.1 hypothetical protein [Actinomycetota bacterium]
MTEDDKTASSEASTNTEDIASKASVPVEAEGTPSAETAEQEVDRLRAENARLHNQIEVASAASSEKKSLRSRAVLSVSLVVLGAILLPLAALTVWTRNQVLNTDRYLETVAPLSNDPAVIDALTSRISTAIEDQLDVKAVVEEKLPENLKILAAPIASGADSLIGTVTSKALNSKQFDTIWVTANKDGHDALVALLTGKKGKVLDAENGKVVLSLKPIVEEILAGIDKKFGLDLSSKIPADKIDIKFTLIDSPQLASLQSLIKWLNTLTWVMVLLALGCFIGAIFAAPKRRKGVLRVGIGVVVSMTITLLALSFARSGYIANLPKGVNTAAATSVFDTLTRFVLQAFRVLFALGAVMVIAAWIAGPSGVAVWIRSLWDRVLGRGGEGIGNNVDLGPVPNWVAAHLSAVRAVILVIAIAVLVTWSRPTGKVVLLIAVLTLIPLALAQLLANSASSKTELVESAGDAAEVEGEEEAETTDDEQRPDGEKDSVQELA